MKIGLWAIAAALGLAIELTPAVADDDLDALLGASADEAPSATRPATDTSGDKAAPAPKTTDVTSDAQADASEDAAAESPAPLATIPVAIKDEKKAPLIAPPKSRGPQLEEIVVTAQKREENLQEVPVAVSAFTAAQLKNISFNDVSNLVGYVPSLNVGTNVSPLSTSFRIRNIGKFSSIPSFEPAVGLFIDGAFRARSGLGLGDLVDVSSIEILKGPQSTLYGKNVSAGVISVNTQAPTREFEGMIETTVGDYNLRQFKGYVSGPLSERFSARLSAVSTRAGPHMQNLVGIAEDDRGSDAIRGQLLFNVTDQLSSRLIVGYVHKDLHPKQGDVFYSPAVTEIIRDAGGQVTTRRHR
jgi:outer membrane receptor protein involved in Fe transport